MSKKARLAVAVLAGLGWIGTARGEDLTLQPQLPTEKPLYLAQVPDKPLASIMKQCGMEEGKIGDINVYGFAEGSYTYSMSNPPGNFITGRVFDIDNQEVLLNQFDLTFEKALDRGALAKAGKWDIGMKVEWVYGADARFIHANGLNFYGPGVQTSPENQFDLVQAYVDVAVPVGSGLLIRGGKFVTLLGYETINPTTNPLYSHSYMFGYAIPFTHTGVLASYSFTDNLSVTGGITRGWEQSTKDNNDSIDYLGQVKYVFNDKLTGFLNIVTGPEQDDDGSNYRTVIDVVATYAATEELSLGINGDYGWEAGAAADGDTAQWFGVAGYAGYKLCESATLNGRVEWFDDGDGTRGIGGTVYEATVGLGIKPFPKDDLGSNLLIRPELRFDYSDDGIFDGGTDNYQFTAGIDAIFAF